MSKKIRPIDYTNLDFDTIKKDLVNYAKRYYPEAYKDFNQASFGSLMMDLVAHVGDKLSFYLDYNANESFLHTSLEYDNVIEHSRQLGYRHQPNRAAIGTIDIYAPIPVDTSTNSPDTRYMPKLSKGSTFATSAGNVFTLVSDVDFARSGTRVQTSETSADGSMISYYAVKTSGVIISGEESQTIVEIGDYQRFLKIEVPGEDITDILSVEDSEGNSYFEVDYLSQNTIYKQIMSRVDFQNPQNNNITPSVMRPLIVPRRFIVERTPDKTCLVFGYGSEEEIKQNQVADPSELVLDIPGKNYISNSSFDPSKLLSTDKFGVAPSNTELTITYRSNTVDTANAAVGTINKVLSPIIKFREVSSLDPAKIRHIVNSLEVTNPEPVNGDIEMLTTDEIKHRAMSTFAMQSRAVTAKDYVAAAYAMPINYGSVKRAAVYKDADDYRRNLNMFIVGQNNEGHLQKSNEIIKRNLQMWLDSVRMINDSIDIFDATIINIGIEFTALSAPGSDKEKVFDDARKELFEKINEIVPEIGEHILLSEVFRILKGVPDLLDISSLSIVPKSSSNHSNYLFDTTLNRSADGRIIYIPKNCIWELKYSSDIRGNIL